MRKSAQRLYVQPKTELYVMAASLLGLLIGFLGVMLAPIGGPLRLVQAPVTALDWEQSFRDIHDVSAIIGDGWGPRREWGLEQRSPRSTLRLDVGQATGADVRATLSGRLRTSGSPDRSVSVSVNGKQVALLHFSKQQPLRTFVFTIPSSALVRSSPAEISFEVAEAGGSPAFFGLEHLQLTTSPPDKVRGHIDACTASSASGWAVADSLAAPVVPSVGGRQLEARYRQVMRPDLARAGIAGDAGFELMWSEALPPGSELSIATGGRVVGKPCRVPG